MRPMRRVDYAIMRDDPYGSRPASPTLAGVRIRRYPDDARAAPIRSSGVPPLGLSRRRAAATNDEAAGGSPHAPLALGHARHRALHRPVRHRWSAGWRSPRRLSKSLQPPTPPSDHVARRRRHADRAARRDRSASRSMRRSCPRYVTDAFLAIEDRRFYSHWGIDPRGIAPRVLPQSARAAACARAAARSPSSSPRTPSSIRTAPPGARSAR